MTEPALPSAPAPPEAPVVVGVNDSQLGLAAVRQAAREAALHGRTLRVIHAFNWSADPSSPLAAEPRGLAERLIDTAVAAAAEAEPGIAITSALIEGPASTALLRESGSAALLVMGDGGLAGCGCASVNTLSVQVAARAGCSVLIVREVPQPAGPVLVGVDGYASSSGALDFAFDAAARRATKLIVVRVWDPDDTDGPSATEIADRLGELVGRWQQRYPSVQVDQRVPTGEPKGALVEQSREAELVVVSGRGEQPWRGLLGAVSQAMLYHSPAPVVIVRGPHGLYIQE